MNNIKTIAKREFFTYINSPLAYVIIVPFLLLISFLFFQSAFSLNDANLRPFIDLLPWFLCILAPALAMKSFSDEKKGTLELLMAHPVSEWGIVIGKFLGIFAFYAVVLASTLGLPLTLLVYGSPDIGVMISQYIGAFLVGALFLSIGIASSAYIKHPIGSLLVAALGCFTIILLSLQFIVLLFPSPISIFVTELGVLQHLNNFGRGVLDLRDTVYFISMTVLFLTLAVSKISQSKIAESRLEKNKIAMVVGLTVIVAVLTNAFLYTYPIKQDLTADKQYSLSSGSKQLINELPDIVTLTLYSSTNLSGNFQVVSREIQDWLKDYQSLSDRIVVQIIPVSDGRSFQQALEAGMQPVRYQQQGSGTISVSEGVLGLHIQYGDSSEQIPLIQDSSQIEYQLSRAISRLTRDTQTRIGYLNGSLSASYQGLENLLDKEYLMTRISDQDQSIPLQDLQAIVVVDDGSSQLSTAAASLRDFVSQGGNVAYFIDGVTVDQQTFATTPSQSAIIDLLAERGVQIEKNLVYDLQLSEQVSMGTEALQYRLQYPFWLKSLVDESKLPWSTNLGNILLGWASSIQIEDQQSGFEVLLSTSQFSGTQTQPFSIAPETINELKAQNTSFNMAAIRAVDAQREIVVADSNLAADNFVRNSPENQNFISNTIDWIAADEVLSSIPLRTSTRSVFVFSTPDEQIAVQLVMVLGPATAMGAFGLFWLLRRRKLSKRVYMVVS